MTKDDLLAKLSGETIVFDTIKTYRAKDGSRVVERTYEFVEAGKPYKVEITGDIPATMDAVEVRR